MDPNTIYESKVRCNGKVDRATSKDQGKTSNSAVIAAPTEKSKDKIVTRSFISLAWVPLFESTFSRLARASNDPRLNW